MPSFQSLPLWINLSLFAATALAVWIAGVHLQGAVEIISRRTGLGSAFGGLVLLAVATSLPELATTITGAVIGNAALLTNNLLGGVAMQTAILVAADSALGRGALTFFAPRFALLLSGVALILLLGVALLVLILGDRFALAGVGLGSTAIFGVYLALFYLTYRSRNSARWEPRDIPRHVEAPSQGKSEGEASLRRQWLIFAACSVVIGAAGWTVMHSAEAITTQTGLGASFIGATLVAIATSLPEVSTTMTAVRRGDNEMAISNIFGSNLWDVALLFVGDLFFRQGPLLAAAPRQAMFMAA